MKRGLSPKVTGGVFFSPLIVVGDLPPLYEEGGFCCGEGGRTVPARGMPHL